MGVVRLIAKWANLLAGCFALAYGINLTRWANLGLGPWDVLHEGLVGLTPFTFGQVNIGVGVVLVLVSYLLGIVPRGGTIANMIVVGLFIDAILVWGWLLTPEAVGGALGISLLEVRVYYLLAGILLSGFGSAWYLASNLGSGPRDALMMGLSLRTGRPVGTIRTIMEALVLLVGWLIGGPVGIGTILTALTVGWVIQFSLVLFKYIATWPPMGGILEVPMPKPTRSRDKETDN